MGQSLCLPVTVPSEDWDCVCEIVVNVCVCVCTCVCVRGCVGVLKLENDE